MLTTVNGSETTIKIKLCPTGAQTCALPLFCDRDLEINPMTLKLEGDLDILKMYRHTENEAARLGIQNTELEFKQYENMSQAPSIFSQ